MKKLLMGLCMVLLLSVPATAAERMTASIDYTADAAVRNTPGVLYGLWVVTDGTNSVTVSVYDNTAASGTTFFPATIIPTAADDRARTITFDPPILYNNGVYVDVTTSGTVTYKVYYKDGR